MGKNKEDKTIIIESYHFWSDYTSTEKNEINLNDILGFKLHWRLEDWHIEVVTKEKISEHKYRTYELHHGVFPVPLAKAIADNRFRRRIISVETNTYDNSFWEAIKKIMEMANKIEKNN